MRTIIKIIIAVMFMMSASPSVSAFDWWTPDPTPKCFYWWCAPSEPDPTPTPVVTPATAIVSNTKPQVHTSISPLFVFGKSDVDRYLTFKAQLNNDTLRQRALYYMDGILMEYNLNQTEFENKYIK